LALPTGVFWTKNSHWWAHDLGKSLGMLTRSIFLSAFQNKFRSKTFISETVADIFDPISPSERRQNSTTEK
jgi:hypothetical protein